MPYQAPGGVGRVDEGTIAFGCSSPSGSLHHPQDAADILQIQPEASQRPLSLREKGASEIPQSRNI